MIFDSVSFVVTDWNRGFPVFKKWTGGNDGIETFDVVVSVKFLIH